MGGGGVWAELPDGEDGIAGADAMVVGEAVGDDAGYEVSAGVGEGGETEVGRAVGEEGDGEDEEEGDGGDEDGEEEAQPLGKGEVEEGVAAGAGGRSEEGGGRGEEGGWGGGVGEDMGHIEHIVRNDGGGAQGCTGMNHTGRRGQRGPMCVVLIYVSHAFPGRTLPNMNVYMNRLDSTHA